MPTADRHLPSTAKERVLSVDNSHSDVTRRRGTRGGTASWPSALDPIANDANCGAVARMTRSGFAAIRLAVAR
jgi:hypothetical protein